MLGFLLALLIGAPGAVEAPVPPGPPAPVTASWRPVQAGIELTEFSSGRATSGDGLIHVVRIDPARWRLRLLNASAEGEGQPLTVRAWAAKHGLAAAINASMYQADLRTSVSLMRSSGNVNNPRLSKDKAILAFERTDPALPPVQIIDRECQDFQVLSRGYATLVQSIRMVSCNGHNVWSPQPSAWSTSAIGIDRQGRVLFIHARSPHSTYDLIEALLAAPIDLRNAMYAEGGHEAQMFVRGGGKEYEFLGGADNGADDGGAAIAWPVPNVIGVEPITGAAK